MTTLKHAKFSASGSSKWLNCAGALNAEKNYQDTTSIYAEEGTTAHEVADLCLKNRTKAKVYLNKTINKMVVNDDMVKYVQEYINYVLSFENIETSLLTEERVDFSSVAPNAFGTMDSAVINHKDKSCHIFDLKYGMGELVTAKENTQAQLYAIGLLKKFEYLEKFTIHIVQPRKFNFDSWEITTKDLIDFGEFVAERATMSLSINAKRTAGEKQCRWCKARFDCKALYDYTTSMIADEFEDLKDIDINVITNEDKRKLLDNKKLIIKYIENIESNVYSKLSNGEQFNGYKLVAGRASRTWKPELEDDLVAKLGDDAYTKKLIGITKAEKLLTKEDMEELTFKADGKPTLAPESDKRKAIELEDIAESFDII